MIKATLISLKDKTASSELDQFASRALFLFLMLDFNQLLYSPIRKLQELNSSFSNLATNFQLFPNEVIELTDVAEVVHRAKLNDPGDPLALLYPTLLAFCSVHVRYSYPYHKFKPFIESIFRCQPS